MSSVHSLGEDSLVGDKFQLEMYPKKTTKHVNVT